MGDIRHRKIICHWGGESSIMGYISPIEAVGDIYLRFNNTNLDALKKFIENRVFPKLEVYNRQLILDNDNWTLDGFVNKEEAIGFLLICFSQKNINSMISQVLNTAPLGLAKDSFMDKIIERLDVLEKKIDDILKKKEEI